MENKFIKIDYSSKRLGQLEMIKEAGKIAKEFNNPVAYDFLDKLIVKTQALQGE